MDKPAAAGDLETTESKHLKEQCYYQPTSGGGRYWHQNKTGRWVHKTASQFSRWLQLHGVDPFTPKGGMMSPLDELLTNLETDRIIDYAGGLAGWRSGVYQMNKSEVLVTHDPDLIEPSPWDGDTDADMWDFEAHGWPLLGQLFRGLFNGVERDVDFEEEIEQLPRFICWLWHFLGSIYNGEYSVGMALAMAGEPECGKTLLSQIINRLSGGVIARPYRYMTGQDNFNEECLAANLLLVDDENSNTHIMQRLEFASQLKQLVASRGTRIRGMHQKAMELQPIQRPMICVNLEPERLQVLPPIDNDIRDKILILKGYSKPMPMPARTPKEQQAFWATLEEEMPFFLWWILHVYEPDDSELGRFGPRAWQHPTILEELSRLNPEARTDEFIQRFLNKRQPRIHKDSLGKIAEKHRKMLEPHFQDNTICGWIGTVSELRVELVRDGDEAALSMLERREVRAVQYLGRDLVALSRRYPDIIFQSREPGRGTRSWIILMRALGEEDPDDA